jgi:hypothetical protein
MSVPIQLDFEPPISTNIWRALAIDAQVAKHQALCYTQSIERYSLKLKGGAGMNKRRILMRLCTSQARSVFR